MVQSFDQQSSHPQDACVPVFRERLIGTFRAKDDVCFIGERPWGEQQGGIALVSFSQLPIMFSANLPFRDKRDYRCLLCRSRGLIVREMIVLIHCV